ncbi:MAG TPA: trimethylamine methyltransferase family protein, partial [Victivallales bacterium]|nr:trimethylamine methyltransferase family protein [Victivallales bacterium]
YFSIIISTEIMHYPLFVIEEIKLCTEYNIPIFMAEMAIGGLSSPATLAGTLIVCLASTFPGIVLSQLFKKGHPCIEASFPTIMDPVTAGVGGFPENAMADSARSQICRKFGLLLSQQTALVTGTTDFDQNCIAQMSWNFGGLITSSFDSFWGAGTLDAGLVYSPHSLVFANELASMARRVWRGIPVDDDSIALDLIKNVDPGMFIMEDHTVVHSRKDIWQGRYIKIKPNDVEKKDISEKIHDDIVNILSSHKGEALSDSILKDIKNIQKK